MSPAIATIIDTLLTIYAAVGSVFAVAFVIAGVDRIDPMARGAGWGFRLLIVPGSALFWPLLLVRWASGSAAPPVELNAHRRRARRSS